MSCNNKILLLLQVACHYIFRAAEFIVGITLIPLILRPLQMVTKNAMGQSEYCIGVYIEV